MEIMRPEDPWRTYSIYGLRLRTNFPLRAPLPLGDGPPDLTFTCLPHPPPEAATSELRPLRHSPILLPSGEPVISLYRSDGYDLIRATEVVEFYLFRDRIIGHLLDPDYYPMIELRLLGAVLAYWCERQGSLMLHASAVVVDGRAVGFMASNEGGKSSLAAGLIQSGFPLLTDDVLRVRFDSGEWWAEPGYPQMRFWPEDAERLLGHYEDLELVHPNYSKRRIPIGPGGFGMFCGDARPLDCVYVPSRGSPGENVEIEIIDVPPGQRVIELIRGTFIPGWIGPAGLDQHRFQLLSELVSKVPVKTVRYPHGFGRFSSVLERVLSDVRSRATFETPA